MEQMSVVDADIPQIIESSSTEQIKDFVMNGQLNTSEFVDKVFFNPEVKTEHVDKIFTSMTSGKSEQELQAEELLKSLNEGKAGIDEIKEFFHENMRISSDALLKASLAIQESNNLSGEFRSDPKFKLLNNFLIGQSFKMLEQLKFFSQMLETIDKICGIIE